MASALRTVRMMSFGAKFSTALVITLFAVDHTTSNPFAKPKIPRTFRCANFTAPMRSRLAAASVVTCASFGLHQTQKVGWVRLCTGRTGQGSTEQPEGSANGRSGHPDRYPNLQLTSLLSSRCRMPHATIMAGSAARIDERLNLEGERAGGYPNREHNP